MMQALKVGKGDPKEGSLPEHRGTAEPSGHQARPYDQLCSPDPLVHLRNSEGKEKTWAQPPLVPKL